MIEEAPYIINEQRAAVEPEELKLCLDRVTLGSQMTALENLNKVGTMRGISRF